MMTRIFAIVVGLVAAMSTAQADETRLLAAGGPQHVFIVAPDAEGTWRVMHHDLIRDVLTPLRALSQPPLAIAARGSSLWLVSTSGPRRQREVFGLEVRTGATGRPQAVPRDRLLKLPALPAEGVLAGFVAAAPGLTVLLVPEPAVPGAEAEPQLLRLDGSDWVARPAPPLDPRALRVHLIAGGEEAERLFVIAAPPSLNSAASRSHLYWADAIAGTWHPGRLDVDARRIDGASIGWGGSPVIAVSTNDGVACLQIDPDGQSSRLLARLAPPDAPWTLAQAPGGGGRVRLYIGRAVEDIGVRTIDTARGTVSDREPVPIEPIAPGERFRGPMLIAIAAFALVMAMLLRPGQDHACRYPAGWGAAPIGARFLALTVDFLPGGLLAVILLDRPPTDLLILPLTTGGLGQALPYTCGIAGAVVIGAIGEALRGTSPGKSLLGLRVVSADAESLRAGQAGLRALARLPVLLAPMLAVFALLNPNGRGLPELLARAVVVSRVDDKGTPGG